MRHRLTAWQCRAWPWATSRWVRAGAGYSAAGRGSAGDWMGEFAMTQQDARRQESPRPPGGRGQPIVVGVDGSPSSVRALRWALRQAGLVGAPVEAVIAWQDPAIYGM